MSDEGTRGVTGEHGGVTDGSGGGEPAGSGLEQRLERLEAIVDRLERDDLDLEAALSLFEEGIGHLRESNAILERTQLRVEKLVVEMDGSVSLQRAPDDE
ncbi:MAG TPA: exodeoxyribonuclease VII small subunit [Longimicrobiales bacterium]|nr:exodeoxyribonuclease VII small subunit [Longimicrobiales bacterium]